MKKRKAKSPVSLAIWEGKRVRIYTDLISTVGDGGSVDLLGIFIYADEHDIYLNTVNRDPSGVSVTINRKNCIMIEEDNETLVEEVEPVIN